MLKILYEVSGDHEIIGFETFDEATAYAEEHGEKTIYEIGGSWGEFEKCEFCGEWYTLEELNRGICWRCGLAIRSRGEEY